MSLVEKGGSQLWAPCPADPTHRAVYDTADQLFTCPQCLCLLLDRRAARALLELRDERDALAAVVAEAVEYPRGRLELARVARIERLYREGLAKVRR